MVTQFDMITGEIVAAEQQDSLLTGDQPVTPALALRLMTIDEAILIQNSVRPIPCALLTQLETAPDGD